MKQTNAQYDEYGSRKKNTREKEYTVKSVKYYNTTIMIINSIDFFFFYMFNLK